MASTVVWLSCLTSVNPGLYASNVDCIIFLNKHTILHYWIFFYWLNFNFPLGKHLRIARWNTAADFLYEQCTDWIYLASFSYRRQVPFQLSVIAKVTKSGYSLFYYIHYSPWDIRYTVHNLVLLFYSTQHFQHCLSAVFKHRDKSFSLLYIILGLL